jgi:hypothetical protein
MIQLEENRVMTSMKPAEALKRIVTERGTGVCAKVSLVEALLRDYCPAEGPAIHCLVNALRQGIPQSLLADPPGTNRAARCGVLSEQLQSVCSMQKESARWSVMTWMSAIGIDPGMADREIRDTEGSGPVTPARSGRLLTPEPPPPEKAPPDKRPDSFFERWKAAQKASRNPGPPPPPPGSGMETDLFMNAVREIVQGKPRAAVSASLPILRRRSRFKSASTVLAELQKQGMRRDAAGTLFGYLLTQKAFWPIGLIFAGALGSVNQSNHYGWAPLICGSILAIPGFIWSAFRVNRGRKLMKEFDSIAHDLPVLSLVERENARAGSSIVRGGDT